MISLLAALTGCGGDGGGGSSAGGAPGPAVSSVAVVPAFPSVTTAQQLVVGVGVSDGTAVTPDGTVTLTSGTFSAGTATLSAGKASFTVPAGALVAGAATLSVQYSPSAAAAASDTAASGTADVTVVAATAPTVMTQSTSVATNGHPFEAQPVGSNVLVSVSANTDAGSLTGVRVFTAATPAQLTYQCTQLASHLNHMNTASALGLSVLPNGLDLALAIDDPGVDFLNLTATVDACSSGETLVPQGDVSTGQGTFAVAITPDGKYAFVANEYGVVAEDSTGANIPGNVGVVALQYDASGHLSAGTLMGQFSTGGQDIANVTLSPDGTRLYVTSEIDQPGVAVSGTGNTLLAHSGCAQASGVPTSTYGLVSVIDVAKAEATPDSSAIIATVAAGCSPVRVVETSDGQIIWVAARGDNRVLAFSTHMLESNPDNALLGYGDTGGVAPVGLQLFSHQQLLAVANSNRFSSPAAVGNMTIMNATPVSPGVIETTAAGYFPRSVTLAADDATLYLTDYDSGIVQIITTAVN